MAHASAAQYELERVDIPSDPHMAHASAALMEQVRGVDIPSDPCMAHASAALCEIEERRQRQSAAFQIQAEQSESSGLKVQLRELRGLVVSKRHHRAHLRESGNIRWSQLVVTFICLPFMLGVFAQREKGVEFFRDEISCGHVSAHMLHFLLVIPAMVAMDIFIVFHYALSIPVDAYTLYNALSFMGKFAQLQCGVSHLEFLAT